MMPSTVRVLPAVGRGRRAERDRAGRMLKVLDFSDRIPFQLQSRPTPVRRVRKVFRTRTSAIMETPFVPAIVTPFQEGSLEIDEGNFKTYLKVRS